MAEKSNTDPEKQYPPPTFDEFTVPTYDEWREVAEKSLKGASFDRKLTAQTYEGFTLQPLYFQENVENLPHMNNLPGTAPFLRGTRSSGYLQNAWGIAQEIPYGLPEKFNGALKHDLEQGQTVAMLIVDEATRAGIDPDHAEQGKVGTDGVSIATLDDLSRALDGIDLVKTPVFFEVGTNPLTLAAFFIAHAQQQNASLTEMRGAIATDPLGELGRYATLPRSLKSAYDEMATLTGWMSEKMPLMESIAVHTYHYHNSGCNAVQELAFALATGVEYLSEMQARGLSVNVVAPRMRFMLSVGADFFMEIAKLRVMRMLWAQIVKAFGGDENAQKVRLHARTATINKTTTDPYVNMLRTTTEALAGAIAGVDSMAVGTFDEVIHVPDEFSRRIARNQQLILQQECNLTNLIDPAGGAWYIETLTHELGQAAWALFQEIEAGGGMSGMLKNELPQKLISDLIEKRRANLNTRRDVLVGTNMYANAGETPINPDKTDYHQLHTDRARSIIEQRDETRAPVANVEAGSSIEDLVDAVLSGATLEQIGQALSRDDGDNPMIVPFSTVRISEHFEHLRHRANHYLAENGHLPRIFLATIGSVAQHKARADFSTGFFEVGGFEMIRKDGEGFSSAQEAATSAIDSGVDALVICSTDEMYPEIVPEFVQMVKAKKPDMQVILAGYPKEHLESFKSAGVDSFIHVKADCYAENARLQQKLGIKA